MIAASVTIGSAISPGWVIAPQVVVMLSLTNGGKMCRSSAKNWIRIRPRKNDGIE